MMTRVDSICFAAARVLPYVSFGKGRVVRYRLYAMAVSSWPVPRSRKRPGIVCRRMEANSPELDEFPRPASVCDRRFRDGAVCYAAFMHERPAGFIWFVPGLYEEDECYCQFLPLPRERAAWDFDVYVFPEFRHTRAFVALWNAAAEHMRRNGIDWTMSRISAFNPGSISAHRRLGAREVGSASFILIGRVQLMVTNLRPRLRLSIGRWRMPCVEVPADRVTVPRGAPG